MKDDIKKSVTKVMMVFLFCLIALITYIAYFQAYTNTYAPLNVLKDKFEEALSFENVIGLSISTRPDCLE